MQTLTKGESNLLNNIFKLINSELPTSNNIYLITKYPGENIIAIKIQLLRQKYGSIDHDLNALIREELVSTEYYKKWDNPIGLEEKNNAVFITPKGTDYLIKERESNSFKSRLKDNVLSGTISGVIVAIILALLGLKS